MQRLTTQAEVQSLSEHRVLKVVDLDLFASSAWNPEECALWIGDETHQKLSHLRAVPFAAHLFPHSIGAGGDRQAHIAKLQHPEIVKPGDVISVGGKSNVVRVLHRKGSRSNTIFITEQCNSNCVMCSQPPRPVEDSWRIQENQQLIRLIDPTERELGISGGEPTLIGEHLVELINHCEKQLPNTSLHVLTNGRLFAQERWANYLAQISHHDLIWGVPLYSDYSSDHDHIVQAPGAFTETIKGLYRLARYQQKVEIRVVLHALTIPRLEQLCHYIFRNLPFCCHVALMGIEPIGFARGNRESLWIDPADYAEQLESAVYFLANRGITVSVYNLPLCALPKSLWPFARQSISDWKNDFVEECSTCSVRTECAGFFTWADERWRSRAIRAIAETTT